MCGRFDVVRGAWCVVRERLADENPNGPRNTQYAIRNTQYSTRNTQEWKESHMRDKVIITAALSGAAPTKAANPAVMMTLSLM